QISRKKRVEYVDDDAELNRILIQLGTDEVRLKNLADGKELSDKQLAEILELLESLDKYARALKRHGGDFAEYVEKRLPRTRNLEDIIRIVTELAKKNGVSFSSFSPAGESSQTYYTEVPFTLSITGTMHSIGKFLSVIGQQERIFSAKGLNISYSPNTKKGYTVSGTFTLYAYIYNG
ncbi:MAG TPA: type 4a pilus biogenesis protein PilO, partial [Elusimicrobiota bacterium]|nr:type 4a pilus biogenesis protein PilO [Elusimicrobiota bacterium]